MAFDDDGRNEDLHAVGLEPSDTRTRPTGVKLWWMALTVALMLASCTGPDSADREAAPASDNTVTSTPPTTSAPSTDVGLSSVQGEAIMLLGCREEPAILCRRLAVSADIEVRAARGSTLVAQTTTARNGTFEFELPAGKYTAIATVSSGIQARPAQASFQVEPGTEAELVLRFQPGVGKPF